LKPLSEDLDELKAQAPQNMSEATEPEFCQCGELRFVAKEQMEIGAAYGDGVYQYGLSTNKRTYREGDGTIVTYQPRDPVFGMKGHCPGFRKDQGFVDPYENMTFEKFDQSNDPVNAFDRVFNFRLPGKLIIGGPRGRGKTHLARASYRGMKSAGKRCVWLKAPGLAEAWRQYAGNYDTETQAEAREFKHKCETADCIYIDDLAEERVPLGPDGEPKSDLFNEQFKLLVESAKSDGITTNSDSTMLRERYGDKIFDRIMEGATTVRMKGQNYRAKSFPLLKA